MNENPLLCWLNRIDLSRVIHYFDTMKITKINQLKQLTDADIRNLDLNEVEKSNLQQAILDIDQDFEKQNKAYKLKLEIVKQQRNEDYFEVGWSGAIIVTNLDQNKHNINLIKYQYGYYWLFPNQENKDPTYYRIQKNDFHILIPDNIFNIGRLEFQVQRYNAAFFEDRGTRNFMEDVTVIRQNINVSNNLTISFFAVFDGFLLYFRHGGSDCVNYVSSVMISNLRFQLLKNQNIDEEKDFYQFMTNAITEAFRVTDDNFYQTFDEMAMSSGCTACVAIIAGNQLFVANVGDSRAVLSREGQAIGLSIDHKPVNIAENDRIINAGGNISLNRVEGKLAVSRAFGDFNYKPISRGEESTKYSSDIIISEPEIRVHTLDLIKDEFMVIGCDGLFDIYNNQMVVDFVYQRLSDMPYMEQVQQYIQDPQIVVQELVENAVYKSRKQKNISDNCSAILVNFNRGIINQ